MDIIDNAYHKTLQENQRNLSFWEEYLKSLKDLDLCAFSEKLRVPVLVPIGSRILFRGELKHTNEVTVALGADYFTKCSIKQAEVLKQHRIKDAEAKVNLFKREREYIEKQLDFSKYNVFDKGGQEIIENYTEEEDKAWREKHKQNVRSYKQKKEIDDTNIEITDDELWTRLEELELQEELENELHQNETEDSKIQDTGSLEILDKTDTTDLNSNSLSKLSNETKNISKVQVEASCNADLLQKVLDKQLELEEKLIDLKNRERSRPTNESELLSRIDELEQLDELEDEIDRLDEVLQNGDIEENIDDKRNIKRSVSFADEDHSEVLELEFKHSDVEPSAEPYDPEKGIQKPSDIYTAYSQLFKVETTSILKKTKYEDTHTENIQPHKESVDFKSYNEPEPNETQIIHVKDVTEKIEKSDNQTLETTGRPVSLFKMKRQKMKT